MERDCSKLVSIDYFVDRDLYNIISRPDLLYEMLLSQRVIEIRGEFKHIMDCIQILHQLYVRGLSTNYGRIRVSSCVCDLRAYFPYSSLQEEIYIYLITHNIHKHICWLS